MLVAKSDNLWKNQGRKNTKRQGHGVAIGEIYMNQNSTHNQNERLLAAILIDNIRAQVSMVEEDRKKKWISFAILLH